MKKRRSAFTRTFTLLAVLLIAISLMLGVPPLHAQNPSQSSIYITHDLRHTIIGTPQGNSIAVRVYIKAGEDSYNESSKNKIILETGEHTPTSFVIKASNDLSVITVLDIEKSRLLVFQRENDTNYRLIKVLHEVIFSAINPKSNEIVLYANRSLQALELGVNTRLMKIDIKNVSLTNQTLASFTSDGKYLAIINFNKENNKSRLVILNIKKQDGKYTANIELNRDIETEQAVCPYTLRMKKYSVSAYVKETDPKSYLVTYSCADDTNKIIAILIIREIRDEYLVVEENKNGATRISNDGKSIYIVSPTENITDHIKPSKWGINVNKLTETLVEAYRESFQQKFTEIKKLKKYEQNLPKNIKDQINRVVNNNSLWIIYDLLTKHYIDATRFQALTASTKTIDIVKDAFINIKEILKNETDSLENKLGDIDRILNYTENVCNNLNISSLKTDINSAKNLLNEVWASINQGNLTGALIKIDELKSTIDELINKVKQVMRDNVDSLINCVESKRKEIKELERKIKTYKTASTILSNILSSRLIEHPQHKLNELSDLLSEINISLNKITKISNDLSDIIKGLESMKSSKIDLEKIKNYLQQINEIDTTSKQINSDLESLWRNKIGSLGIKIGDELRKWIKQISEELSSPATGFFPGVSLGVDSGLQNRLSDLNKSINEILINKNISNASASILPSLGNDTLNKLEKITSDMLKLEEDVLATKSSLAMQATIISAAITAIVVIVLMVTAKYSVNKYIEWVEDKPRREKVAEAKKIIRKLRKRATDIQRLNELPHFINKSIRNEVNKILQNIDKNEKELRKARTLAKAEKVLMNLREIGRELGRLEELIDRMKRICSHGRAVANRGLFVGATDVGGRLRNEDYFTATLIGECVPVIAVADGVGGMKAGNIASRRAVETLVRTLDDSFRKDPLYFINYPVGAIVKAFDEANNAVANLRKEYGKAATTLTAAIVLDDEEVVIGHIGDSRAYLIRPATGEIKQLTEDDTLVNQLLKEKKIKPEEAKTHPQRHVLIKALGSEEPTEPQIIIAKGGRFVWTETEGLTIHIREHRISDRDLLLLCTDGLTDALGEEEILTLVQRITNNGLRLDKNTLEKVAKYLILNARRMGSDDNITVVIYAHRKI